MEKQIINRNFDVQSIGINIDSTTVFEFIAKPENLPLWKNAFSKANQNTASMITPAGELNIKLETLVSKNEGTVDWIMTMPNGSIGKAYSRVSENGENTIYSFMLLAPPVPLEQLEGALFAQKTILAEELKNLKRILEKNNK